MLMIALVSFPLKFSLLQFNIIPFKLLSLSWDCTVCLKQFEITTLVNAGGHVCLPETIKFFATWL